ncbi:hypothetical protein AZOA_03210 [Azoarcus sp. Aa7]|nr:hypothetical protein [Azoarcus sp. Aa7]
MAESQTPRVAISSLTFSDGTDVPISPNDVVLVVGPNNAGKSAGLRAIREKLQNAAHKSPVLQSLKIQRTGSVDEFSSWLLGWTVRQMESPPDNPIYQALGHALHRNQAHSEWQRADNVLGGLARWFCHLLSADERLQICNPPGNIALARDNPSHPIHFLLRDDKLESRLSSKFRKAFGVDLVVHRNAGSQVPLHIGERPTPAGDEDRVSISYIERLEKLPTLHTQGDGMRSFAGVLLATSVGRESIVLIDEPEAFLHPPQARLLGTTLVQDRNKERQLFIATHSTDILRGVLDTESPDVRVIRIRRSGSTNTVRLLSNERIKELWGDPLLRYSNILDGLFHESVVVCEADADCRFYSAILDATMAGNTDDAKRPDLMFTHCGGKARLPVVIRALREVDVPVRAVADFDVLSEEEPLKTIAEALGIDWAEIQPDWRQVKNAVDSKKPDLSTDEVRKEIGELLSAVTTTIFPPKTKADIQTVLKRTSPWAHAKLVGKAFVPSGDPSKACERLLSNLRAGGLHVVEVGELEGYVRTEGGHGPKWVNAVLTRELATDPELEAARKFVQALAAI